MTKEKAIELVKERLLMKNYSNTLETTSSTTRTVRLK